MPSYGDKKKYTLMCMCICLCGCMFACRYAFVAVSGSNYMILFVKCPGLQTLLVLYSCPFFIIWINLTNKKTIPDPFDELSQDFLLNYILKSTVTNTWIKLYKNVSYNQSKKGISSSYRQHILTGNHFLLHYPGVATSKSRQ